MLFRESETSELKSTVIDDIKKDIIAFANSNGGKVYIGVQDDGSVLGIDNPDQACLQISNMIRDAVKPDLTMFLHYETVETDGKFIIVVDVQQGTDRPYYIAKKGLRPEGVYVRQGYSSAPATDTMIRKMIKETDGDHFEDLRSLEQNLTFDSAAKEFSDHELAFGPAQKKTLGIINEDKLYTNLALLLSDQCVHTIKAAVFEGTSQNQFKDRKEFTGSLFSQMNDLYDYIDFRNQLHSDFDKLQRIDRRDYPEMAVREALLNLIIHREYSFRASSLVSIYADRIEFTSIGGLVNGITLNDVMMGISVCRNMKLANIFYRLNLIEAYGTGVSKIVESYEGASVQPLFEVSENTFKVTLPNMNFQNAEERLSKNAENEKADSSKEEQVLSFAKSHGEFTRKDIENLLKISQTTAGRILKKLTANGLVLQKGDGKNTYYCLMG